MERPALMHGYPPEFKEWWLRMGQFVDMPSDPAQLRTALLLAFRGGQTASQEQPADL